MSIKMRSIYRDQATIIDFKVRDLIEQLQALKELCLDLGHSIPGLNGMSDVEYKVHLALESLCDAKRPARILLNAMLEQDCSSKINTSGA